MDDRTLRLIEVAGTWTSGIGTMLAVIVSLYLARRQTAISIQLSAGVRLFVTPGEEQTPEFVAIKAINAGQQSITLTHIGWRIGLFKKKHFVQMVAGHPLSSTLPIVLAPGQQAQYFIPLDRSPNWVDQFAEQVSQYFPRLSARTLRICASATLGPTITRKAEQNLLDLLVAARKDMKIATKRASAEKAATSVGRSREKETTAEPARGA